MPERGYALAVEDVRLSFGRPGNAVPVLDDLSIAVRGGEFVTVIGPSGSGKSSLFHVVGGLYPPGSGRVLIRGEDVTGTRGHISYMPQQPALFPWRSIQDNVLHSAEIAGLRNESTVREARDWLARVGLAGYEDAYPDALSGGMQQRVAFLRALMSPRELLCLDEPFSALDSLTRRAMQQWLLRVWEQHRRSVLFVTHDIEEALLLSDTVYVLSKRPARVVERLEIGFPRPRVNTIMDTAEFIKLRRHIIKLLEHEGSYLLA